MCIEIEEDRILLQLILLLPTQWGGAASTIEKGITRRSNKAVHKNGFQTLHLHRRSCACVLWQLPGESGLARLSFFFFLLRQQFKSTIQKQFLCNPCLNKEWKATLFALTLHHKKHNLRAYLYLSSPSAAAALPPPPAEIINQPSIVSSSWSCQHQQLHLHPIQSK